MRIEKTENGTRKVPLGMILDKMIEQNGFISEDLKNALIMADKAGIGTEDSPLPDYQWILTDDRKLTYKAPVSAEADLVLLLRAKSGDQDAQVMLINIWSDFTYKTISRLYPKTDRDEYTSIINLCMLETIKNSRVIDIKNDIFIDKSIHEFEFYLKKYMFSILTDIKMPTYWREDLYNIKKYCRNNNIDVIDKDTLLSIAKDLEKNGKTLHVDKRKNKDVLNDYITIFNNGYEAATNTVTSTINTTDNEDCNFWDMQSSEKAVEDQIKDFEILQPILDAYKDNQKIQIFYDLYANELSFKEIMEKYNCKKSTIDSAIRVAKRIIVHELQKDPETYAILQRDYSGKIDIDNNDEATA